MTQTQDAPTPIATDTSALRRRFEAVRAWTEHLAAPLSPEDQVVQSMPDASPTKWHRGHTTWFFEEFVLSQAPGYQPVDPAYRFLFNSYYEAVGPRQPRPRRGLITRPDVHRVGAFRQVVDERILAVLADDPSPDVAALIELGTHHEQQHQELLLMDIKHALAQNPARPAYADDPVGPPTTATSGLTFTGHDGGLVDIGHDGRGFAFDNEGPRHRTWLDPFALADRLVTNGEWMAFMADEGYARPELWLSDGWATVQAQDWRAPLYWQCDQDGRWQQLTLTGMHPVSPAVPVVHISYYEADAYARWAGLRLPTEAEWEVVASTADPAHQPGLHPRPANGGGMTQLFGEVWQWTASPYTPYPGFRPVEGAVGEYNGKFMVDQHVLRGSACITPVDHARATYRNFYPSAARWPFTGLRLAADA